LRQSGFDEAADFWVIGVILLQVLDVTRQMRVAVLERAGSLVVRVVAIDHQGAG
jgi:hypothetical protein